MTARFRKPSSRTSGKNNSLFGAEARAVKWILGLDRGRDRVSGMNHEDPNPELHRRICPFISSGEVEIIDLLDGLSGISRLALMPEKSGYCSAVKAAWTVFSG